MEKYAVIVAGGAGLRMGCAIPKQFLLLGSHPVLYYSLQAFVNAFADLQVILVLSAEHFDKGAAIVQQTNAATRIQMVAGGSTRFDSVKNGLEGVAGNSIVFVHDGVRCLVDESLIHRCYKQALSLGSAIPAITATDTIRIQEGGTHYLVDRNNVRIIQTPQTFQSELLHKAFQQPYQNAFTDEASVVEALGEKVHLVEGNHNNIKITRPLDLLIAEAILKERLALQ